MSLKRFLLFLIFAFVAKSGFVAAQNTGDEYSQPSLRDDSDATSEFITTVWKSGEGLPVNEVEDLVETPDGYLWLGTHQGLVRFDGVRFQSYFTIPTGLRYGTRVGPLELDGRGRLWFALDEAGLAYWEAGVFREVLTNGVAPGARVVSLCAVGTNGLMWVDGNGGLGRVPLEDTEQTVVIKAGNATGNSRWIRGKDGELWLVNPRNLKIYEGERWRDITVPGSASMVATRRREGGLWIAREARLRFVTADGANREVATVPWRGQSRVQCMLEDTRGRLWIGTVGQGLYCYTDGEFKQVVSTASSVTCLLEDSQDGLWVGTRGGGLIRVRERQFFVHGLSSGLDHEFVRSLAQDTKGRTWLLTAEGGLGWLENGKWRQFTEADGWPGVDSLCVRPARDGTVWISTARRGLWRWRDGKFGRHQFGGKAPKEPAVDLLEDQRGKLWMVTDNSGIYSLEANTLTEHSSDEGLLSSLIRCLAMDESGVLWAGDWEGGISRWRDDRWELVRKSSGHGDAVRAMVASEGVLWIGTSAGGLLRFKDGKSDRISVEQGLPDTSIRQLLLDGRGSLWGGTPHKLFRIGLHQLNAAMDGQLPRVEPVTYGRSDGLPDVSFASWCDPRSWRATNGELWFATANGAIRFQPEDLPVSTAPRVLLEQTLVNGKPVTSKALHELRPGAQRIEFRFTAPCLTSPERVRFRYQLTGVDADWVDGGTARTATYASLPAGRHQFRVLASSPEGVWDSEAAIVGLAVHPFFWQTNWFLAGIAAALAGGSVWIVRRATVRRLNQRLELMRRQNAMDRERARIAQDIHDELGASLTSIGLLADLGTRHKLDPPALERDLGQISQTARESVAAMDAIVWALNPRNDTLDHFANYVAQFTREFFRPTQLRTRLDLPTDLPSQSLAAETRHQLFLLVKESFNNIVRHAQASEVQLQLACVNGDLRLTIADNGKGLPEQNVSVGRNGLANLHERIERLGGKLRIESKTGQGVRLEFVLPLHKLAKN